jgi:hypothetical protein
LGGDRAAVNAKELGPILERLTALITCSETIDFAGIQAALDVAPATV